MTLPAQHWRQGLIALKHAATCGKHYVIM
jgi:hypothetical protein